MLHHSKLSLKNIWNHSVISLCLKVKNNDEMLEDCPKMSNSQLIVYIYIGINKVQSKYGYKPIKIAS